VAAPCSQWIACSPVRSGIVAGRSTQSLGIMARCPSCNVEIDASSTKCLNCGALFGPGSSWAPIVEGAPPIVEPPVSMLPLLHLAVGVIAGVLMAILSWGMYFPESPLHAWVSSISSVRGVLSVATFPAQIVTVIGTGGGHGGGGELFLGAVFFQWAILGALFSWVVTKLLKLMGKGGNDA
jgi:hypothetical protein